MVAVKDIELINARFPSLATASAAPMEHLVRQLYPATGMTIGLDRILAALEASKAALHDFRQARKVLEHPEPT